MLIFDEVIDNVRFRTTSGVLINYFSTVFVPEPGTAALLAVGLVIAWRRDSQLRPRPA
jgi:hypothetical protein